MQGNRPRASSMKTVARALGALVALWLALAPPAQSQADFSALMDLLSPAVVFIETPGSGSGTGFILSHRTADGDTALDMVTACHVVHGAPKTVQSPGGYPLVNVSFKAWVQGVSIQAAVTRCDEANDAALLVPVDETGRLSSLSQVFRVLADERRNPKLRQIPALWQADEQTPVRLLEPAFFLGYPGPFSEFSVNVGTISAQLPVSFVQAADQWVGMVERLLIYDPSPDDAITQANVLYFDPAAAMGVEALARTARQIMQSGHSVVLLAQGLSPTDVRAWEVVQVADDRVLVQERPITLETALGYDLHLLPRTDLEGSVAFQRQFLKVDAAVGAGYSGGPVLNQSGQVIGMLQWEVFGLEGANYAGLAKDVVQSLFE